MNCFFIFLSQNYSSKLEKLKKRRKRKEKKEKEKEEEKERKRRRKRDDYRKVCISNIVYNICIINIYFIKDIKNI